MDNLSTDEAEKAAFEKAMTDKINKDGYKMSDLLFEVYQLQKQVSLIKSGLYKSGLFELQLNADRTPVHTDECQILFDMAAKVLDEQFEKDQIDKCALKPTKKAKSAKEKGLA